MKRLHVHVAVKDIDQSIRFYSTLFGTEPSVVKPDYAKWMLEDPRVNFAISNGHEDSGIRHLGIQVDDSAELAEVAERLSRAERPVLDEVDANCCYAKSDKHWVADPQDVVWETFFSHGVSTVYGNDVDAEEKLGRCAPGSVCCEPQQLKTPKEPVRATTGCC